MNRHFKYCSVIFLLATFSFISKTSFNVNAQNLFKDLEGRFSFVQPDDWTLQSEQMNQVYKFGDPAGSVSMVLTYMEDVGSLDDLITMYLESIIEMDGGILPPKGSIVDMTLNGSSARWIEYPFDMNTGTSTVKLYVYIGGVVDQQQRGIAFFSMLNDNTLQKYGSQIKHSFETLQMHDLPLTGISNVQEMDIDYSTIVEISVTPASTFEHELFTVDVPAGWSSEKGSGATLVKLEREGDGSCSLSILGNKKNQFGATQDKIQSDMADGLIAGIPSMKKVKGPYEVTTSAGEVITVEEFEGSVEASGKTIELGGLIAAAKNKQRGLGFMGIFSISIKEEAINEMTTIIKTLR